MVYANLVFSGKRNGTYNLGDDAQLIALEYMYNAMGMRTEDIVRVPFSELRSYDGDYAVLPISYPLYGYQGEGTDITLFSPKIIPVFLGLSLITSNLSEGDVNYLKRFEPIGCRDFHTVKTMRKYGILAYLNGCMTVTLPKENNCCGTRPYLVDIPERYKAFIPQDILENAVWKTQIINGQCDNPEGLMKQYMKEYRDEASVVITTRLHCALPCIAMGIPVIIMKDHYSFRFPVLTKYIHPYESDEFLKINWHPEPIEYEEAKRMILEGAIKRVKETYEKYKNIFDISYFYEKDNLRSKYYLEHVDNVIDDVKPFFDAHSNIRYGIWGITQKADMIIEYINSHYPDSRLTVVYDRSKNTSFRGIQCTNDVENLLKGTDFIFVTTYTANAEAVPLFEQRGIINYSISTDGIENTSKERQ